VHLQPLGERLAPFVRAPILNKSLIFSCFSPQDDATLKCWGENAGNGQLGLGYSSNLGFEANGPCPPSSTTASLCPTCFDACSCSPRRDGDESPFGRPGGWEDGRCRQQWGATYVHAAGKSTQGETVRRVPAEWSARAPHPNSLMLLDLRRRHRFSASRLETCEARI
jgi:hypothetical protein